jgi:predicted enzyme involved in methoxymalonyl-ACP biosynthesis
MKKLILFGLATVLMPLYSYAQTTEYQQAVESVRVARVRFERAYRYNDSLRTGSTAENARIKADVTAQNAKVTEIKQRVQSANDEYMKQHPTYLRQHPELLKQHPEYRKRYAKYLTPTNK